MANEDRRDFMKRLFVGGGAVAVSFGFVQATAPSHHRGQTNGTNNNVVVGRSPKVETLYQKSEYWDKFYKSAL